MKRAAALTAALIIVVVWYLAVALGRPAPEHATPPPMTPVLPPPIACGIPGWPPCFHYVYMPAIEGAK